MAGIEIRTDLLPLVRITNHEHTTDADYVALLSEVKKLIDRGDKFVVMALSRGVAFPNPAQRKIIADFMPTVKGRMERCSLGTAMVLTNPVQRGAITALNWIMRPDVPMVAVETEAEGLSWCRAQLEKAGVPIPTLLAAEFERGARKSRVG